MREKEEAEKRRKAAQKAAKEREARYTTPSRAQGTQTGMASARPAVEYQESLD